MVLSPTSVAKKLILPIFKIFKKEDFFSVKSAQCSCSLVTGLGKFDLKACFGGWGLWKNPNLRSRLWKPNFSKSINSEQFLPWIPQHCAQSWSDNIYIYPLIARLQVSRVWRERASLQGIEKIESRLGFWFHWWFWIESLVRYLLVLAADRGIVF